eukprot:m.237191 g.237191  ORF g.237191 m.237191 type:complete len:96 (+) comp17108_c0_seq16:185-472(+)
MFVPLCPDRGGERCEVDYLVLEDADDPTWRENPGVMPESIRKKEVAALDPVFRVNLQPQFAQVMNELFTTGAPNALEMLDPSLQAQVRELLGLEA